MAWREEPLRRAAAGRLWTMQGVLQQLQVVVFSAVALVAASQWWRRRTEAAAWMTATLGILAYVVAISRLLPTTGAAAEAVRSLNVAVLALFPYALYRFMRSFLPPIRPLAVAATVSTITVVGWSLVIDLPAAEEPRGPVAEVFIGLFLVHWTVLSTAAAVRLWRAGTRQAAMARNRMRLMSVGAMALNLALLLAALAVDAAPWVSTVTGVLVLAAALSFYAGFAPPRLLRLAWRRSAERTLRDVQLRLVASSSLDDVGTALAPFVTEVLGGHGTVLVDSDGQVVATHGLSEEEGSDLAARLGDGATSSDDVLVVPMRSATLAVQSSPFTPYFGDDEIELLRTLAAYVDLALERAELAEREREARDQLTRANAELEALVFGISHDLKSPIITLLGFVDLLRTGYGDQLDDDARHYLTRMSVSALYMQDLLNDLLELSRIGRVQTEVEPVDLDELVADVSEHVASQHARLEVRWDGLPTVLMSPGRARQLFTNLVENAAKHGGREDVTVTITAEYRPEEELVAIDVEDDGQGIPAEYREKIFGIFERLEDGGVSTQGTGIGLAICRKIVEEVGGGIDLLSSGSGTTFRITLPSTALAGSGPPHHPSAREAHA